MLWDLEEVGDSLVVGLLFPIDSNSLIQCVENGGEV